MDSTGNDGYLLRRERQSSTRSNIVIFFDLFDFRMERLRRTGAVALLGKSACSAFHGRNSSIMRIGSQENR